MKKCVLGLREVCNDCGACDNRCELNPNKICDNCFKCLETTQDYAEIPIGSVILTEEDYQDPLEQELHEEMDLEDGSEDSTGPADDSEDL